MTPSRPSRIVATRSPGVPIDRAAERSVVETPLPTRYPG
jgi:hypothetical protein